MNIYLDESGDLGWKLAKPYMNGGSSRFLTIGILVIPKSIAAKTKRLVRKLYTRKKFPITQELKATNLQNQDRIWLANKVATLCQREQNLKLISITVKKRNVQQHLRDDPNKLYNYMIRLALIDHISRYPSVDFIPDKRSVKVASGNSLADYLQIYLWYEMNVQTKINNIPQESHKNLNLQFIDFITNFVWRRHEFNKSTPYNKLRNYLDIKELFF